MPHATNRRRRTGLLFVRTLAACALWLPPLAATACAKAQAAALSSTALAADDPVARLDAEITGDTQRAGVQHGIWAVVVDSLDRHERLIAINPATLLVPASAAKLVSVAAASEAVGWDFRFETRLETTGIVTAGTLAGDIIVVGSGDPSIGGRGGEDLKPWAAAVKAAGIHTVDGRVIGDDNAVEEPRPALAWAWDDLGYTAGSLFGALNFAENRMTVTVVAGNTVGHATTLTVDGFAARRPIVNRTVTGAVGSAPFVWPEQRPGEPFLTIAGSVPAGAGPAHLQVSAGNPTLWFAHALRAALVEAGIMVTGDAFDIDDLAPAIRPATTTLYVHRSPPLADLVRPLLKDSVNLYAEAVMRLNTPTGVFPTNDAALDGFRRRLTGWGILSNGQQLVDGSGLSRRDVVTADTLARVLSRMHDPTGTSPWMMALPIAGVDGSLDGRMKGTAAAGTVQAKTGTMSNVRSLAGYATTRTGEHLAFAVIINNFEGSGAQAVQAIDAIAVRLASFER